MIGTRSEQFVIAEIIIFNEKTERWADIARSAEVTVLVKVKVYPSQSIVQSADNARWESQLLDKYRFD